jgi:hypothetical protein
VPPRVEDQSLGRGATRDPWSRWEELGFSAGSLVGFQVLPRRWVVERFLAWINRNRRLARIPRDRSPCWLYDGNSAAATATTGSTMVERVAVLLGTVQFRLKVKGNVPESTTLVDAGKAAWAMLRQHPVRSWTLVDELGVVHSVQLSINDFF